MLATIIHEIYANDDAYAVATAIDDICSPNDNYGWASSGVYCFREPNTDNILYIGYTGDLHQRFCDHNGMSDCKPNSCKWTQIEEFLKKNGRIGFSFFAQSTMDQNRVFANTEEWLKMANPASLEAIKHQQGENRAKFLEGALIEAAAITLGEWPPWNKTGGKKEGKQFARNDHYDLIRYLAGAPSALTARFTLRQLSNDPSACGLEEALHGARIYCLNEAVLHGSNEIGWNELYDFLVHHDPTQASFFRERDYPNLPIPC